MFHCYTYADEVAFSLVLHLQWDYSHGIIKYAAICEIFVNALHMCGHSIMISHAALIHHY